MKVTVQQLIDRGACAEQVELCAAMWGSGEIEVNAETCAEAAALGLDADWAADNLLPKTLGDAYLAQRKPLYEAYLAQRKPLDEAYEAQCWAAFAKITGKG